MNNISPNLYHYPFERWMNIITYLLIINEEHRRLIAGIHVLMDRNLLEKQPRNRRSIITSPVSISNLFNVSVIF